MSESCGGKKATTTKFADSGVCVKIAHLLTNCLHYPPLPKTMLKTWLRMLSANVCEINAHSRSAGLRQIRFNFVFGERGDIYFRALFRRWAILTQTPVFKKMFKNILGDPVSDLKTCLCEYNADMAPSACYPHTPLWLL